MSKAYMCDSCGKAILNPHEVKMKEFYLAAECDMCGVFPVKAKSIKKIHLCDVCFSQLRYVANAL